MRRRSALLPLALVAGTLLLSAPVAVATASDSARPSTATASPIDPSYERTLTRASRALNGRADTPVTEGRIDATLALRDLFLARPDLDPARDRRAGVLLARPSDGGNDPYGDGYSVRSTRACDTHVCVHWVTSTADAPPDAGWAKTTLRVMERVWKHHVDTLGYREPAKDGGRGGNAKFDVYLKELGSQGLYGYCAPESRVPGRRLQAAGFCVLDDDFARRQFGRAPVDTLRVTAAHEFFHAVQFAYDFREDPWLLESTATWIEERFADDVNDNRNYLRFGQLSRPSSTLDLFDNGGFAHYGNWPFWEFLSERFGNQIVRQVIQRSGTGDGLANDYSIEAVRRVLASKGGFTNLFAAYAGGNTVPGRTYEEGSAFPAAAPDATKQLRRSSVRLAYSTRLNHLAAATIELTPDDSLAGKRWRLQLKIDAPNSRSSPAAYLIVKKEDGGLVRRSIALNDTGFGMTQISFNTRTTSLVTLTLANVSTRYRCEAGTAFSCTGAPRDQGQRFAVNALAYRA